MKMPYWSVPLLIVLIAVSSVMTAGMFSIPSVTIDFEQSDPKFHKELDKVIFIVDGVKCVDTARDAAINLYDLDGIHKFTAYASHNRVEILYDSQKVDIDTIIQSIEDPIFVEETGEILFDLYTVRKIDGEPI